jgi:hypothetical protein
LQADGFDAFRRLVLEDDALQEDLRQAASQESLFEKVLALGRERGFRFSKQDLEDAVRANRRAWLERWLYQ